jgi:hypothetical protein
LRDARHRRVADQAGQPPGALEVVGLLAMPHDALGQFRMHLAVGSGIGDVGPGAATQRQREQDDNEARASRRAMLAGGGPVAPRRPCGLDA